MAASYTYGPTTAPPRSKTREREFARTETSTTPTASSTGWEPLRPPERAVANIGEDVGAILATLHGQSRADVESALILMRPGTLTTLQTSGLVKLDAVHLVGRAQSVTLTDYGCEVINWCWEHIPAISPTPPAEFDAELAALEANISD